jgi:hypothetical protein
MRHYHRKLTSVCCCPAISSFMSIRKMENPDWSY